jgi:hypothetical protein
MADILIIAKSPKLPFTLAIISLGDFFRMGYLFLIIIITTSIATQSINIILMPDIDSQFLNSFFMLRIVLIG